MSDADETELPKWGLVATIREDVEETKKFVAHHLCVGASELHIYFDDPEDPAYPLIKDMPGVIATLCDEEHWGGARPEMHQNRQIRNATAAYKAANVQWLAHIDADEFIVCGRGVASALKLVGEASQQVRMPPVEPFRVAGEKEPRIYRAVLVGDARGKRIAASAYGDAYEYTNGGLMGHLYGKVFARTGLEGGGLDLHVMTINGKRAGGAVTDERIKLVHMLAYDADRWVKSLARRFESGSYRPTYSRANKTVARKKIGQFLHEKWEEGGADACLAFLGQVQNFGPEKHVLRRAGAILRYPLELNRKVGVYFPEPTATPLIKTIVQEQTTGQYEGEIDFRGMRMIVGLAGNFTEEMLAKGVEVERAELDAFAEIVGGKRVHFLDVGANAGIYSLLCAKLAGKGSQITAFEPMPLMNARLRRNLALNGFAHVDVRQIALGEAAGEVDFYLRPNLGQSSVLKGGRDRGVLKVRMETITQFYEGGLDGFDTSVMKIDIEGAEPQALSPLFAAEGCPKPEYILYEHSHSRGWSITPDKLFGDAGYETHLTFKDNTIAKRAD